MVIYSFSLVLSFFACIADGVFCLKAQRVPCCAPFTLQVVFSLFDTLHRRRTEMSQMDTMRKANRLDSVFSVPDYYEGRFEGNYLYADSLPESFARNNVYASDSDTVVFRNIYYLYKEYKYYDFQLDSLSPARGIADSIVAKDYPADRLGNIRKPKPDAGCYEYIDVK